MFLPFLSTAQEPVPCELNRETDPYTKETVVSTGFFTLENATVDISASRFEIDIFFSIVGTDNCFDNNSTAMIFFEGSKLKLTARNAGSMNCDGYFHIIFKNSPTNPSLLQKMMGQKVSQVLFTGNNKKETVISFGPDQDVFKGMLNCVVAEGKQLIK
jgi:hypothetical protein